MHIVARAQAFVESLRRLAQRRDIDWRQCPAYKSRYVYRHGTYTRHPRMLEGRQELAIQRYQCQDCKSTYSEQHPDLLPGCWYARSVRRYAIDQYMHTRISMRRVAEWVRSMIGKQERWHIWFCLSTPPLPPSGHERLGGGGNEPGRV